MPSPAAVSSEPIPIPFDPSVSLPLDPNAATRVAASGLREAEDEVVAVEDGEVGGADTFGGVAFASMDMNCALDASMTTW
jgi:hypothetical protein